MTQVVESLVVPLARRTRVISGHRSRGALIMGEHINILEWMEKSIDIALH